VFGITVAVVADFSDEPGDVSVCPDTTLAAHLETPRDTGRVHPTSDGFRLHDWETVHSIRTPVRQ